LNPGKRYTPASIALTSISLLNPILGTVLPLGFVQVL